MQEPLKQTHERSNGEKETLEIDQSSVKCDQMYEFEVAQV